MRKISPSMIEAGVATMQRNAKMGEDSLVAKIYSVMEEVRVRDEASLKATSHGYVHQKFPGWRYGPNGEKQVFDRAEDVPEGWSDSPDKAAHADKKKK